MFHFKGIQKLLHFRVMIYKVFITILVLEKCFALSYKMFYAHLFSAQRFRSVQKYFTYFGRKKSAKTANTSVNIKMLSKTG